jgi:hypothetical protein
MQLAQRDYRLLRVERRAVLRRDLQSQRVFALWLLPTAAARAGRHSRCSRGAGRDARAVATLGHEGTAFDASPALVALAEHHVGQTVHCLRFQDISRQDAFDGIWACASLPYVPAAKLPVVMRRLRRALKPGVVL